MAERKDLTIGMKIRNIKTRTIGEITNFSDSDTAILKYDGQDGTFAARVSDLELLVIGEFTLLKKLIDLKQKKKELTDELAEITSSHSRAEEEMVDWLIKHDQESTKVYEGYGRVAIVGQSPKASISEENKEEAFSWIRELGRGEIIKPAIHPSTLNSFVDELINEGKVQIPKFISYILKPKVSITKK